MMVNECSQKGVFRNIPARKMLQSLTVCGGNQKPSLLDLLWWERLGLLFLIYKKG